MKVHPVGKQLSEIERAYIAGFLDADGAIMATIERHQEKKFKFRVRVEVKITQSQPLSLQWFRKKVGVGYIRKNRSAFDWQVRDQLFAQKLLEVLSPYLKVKKKQADIALKILTAKKEKFSDLLRIARFADTLSQYNVRSKNRRKNFAAMIEESCSRND